MSLPRGMLLSLFIAAFVLLFDLWNWQGGAPTLGWFGLPVWVFYFALLQGIWIVLVWMLSDRKE